MRRDFGLHFAAWFLLGTPFVLLLGFLFKPVHAWFGPETSRVAVFCYTFLVFLFGSCLCAIIDVFVVDMIVARFKRR